MGRTKKKAKGLGSLKKVISTSETSDYEDERRNKSRSKVRHESLPLFQRKRKTPVQPAPSKPTRTSSQPESEVPSPNQEHLQEPSSAQAASDQRRAQTQPQEQPHIFTAADINLHRISFRDEAQKARYNMLSKKEMCVTRYADVKWMKELGLEDDLKLIFKKLGLFGMWDHAWPTYPKYVLEFFSSLTAQNPVGSDGTLKFRLDEKEITMRLSELNTVYKFHDSAKKHYPDSFVAESFWKEISLDPTAYNASSSKASRIVNPVFRYFHRVMSNTIQARGDSQGNVRKTELLFLFAALLWKGKVDIGFYFLNQLLSVASKSGGKICIGGMLTPLFQHFDCDLENAGFLDGSRLIDNEALNQAGFFTRCGMTWFWISPRLQLPNPERTSLKQRKNWLLQKQEGEDTTSQTATGAESSSRAAVADVMIDWDQLVIDPSTQPPPPSDQLPTQTTVDAEPSQVPADTPMIDLPSIDTGSGAFSLDEMRVMFEDYRRVQDVRWARYDEQMKGILAFQDWQKQMWAQRQEADEKRDSILQRLEQHFFPPPPTDHDDRADQ